MSLQNASRLSFYCDSTVYKRLKIGPSFLPTLRKFAFYFIARLQKWRSANGTQLNFAKWWTVNRANSLLQKSRGHSCQKIGQKYFIHLFGFWTTLGLIGEYLLNERRYRQSGKGVGNVRGVSYMYENIMNFCPQTAKNRTGVGFAHRG